MSTETPFRTKALAVRLRVVMVYGFMAVLLFGAMGRVFALSVSQNDKYAQRALENSTTRIPIPPERGRIISRDGQILAQTIFSGTSVFINVRQVRAEDRPRVAKRLATYLALNEQRLAEKLERHQHNAGLPISFFVSNEQAFLIGQAMDAGELPGVHFRERVERKYPKGNLAAQTIGFVNQANQGSGGIELAYDRYLSGKDGYQKLRKDARGRLIPNGEEEIDAPEDGADVYLTIDTTIQHFAQDALAKLVEDWDPDSCCAVVIESSTGRVLAMANYPTFDPNEFRKADQSAMKNQALTDAFEPGSIFKPLLFAGAMEDGVVDWDTPIPYRGTVYTRGRCTTDGSHPVLRKDQVGAHGGDGSGYVLAWMGIVKSSNTMANHVAQSIYAGHAYPSMNYQLEEVLPFEGTGRLDARLRGFGFGEYTGIDIGGPRGGESRGILPGADQWTNIPNAMRNVIPSIGMGYQVQVTAMQMLACFNAIAIDGVRMKPYVVEKVATRAGTVLYEQNPEVAGDSGFSAETAAKMREILEHVVSSDGTARQAQLKDYRLAGKTGTASIAGKGGYLVNQNVCSFVGFAPVEAPKLSIIVTARRPKKHKKNQYGNALNYYGGSVAAPYMAEIMDKSLRHLGVEPSAKVEDEGK